MPAKKHKLFNGKYSVSTPNGVHAKSTTKKKAEAQVRLLNAIDHGWKPDKSKHHSAQDGEFLSKRRKAFNVD